ncbi:hypothetical protein [Brucella lupini]|uniref:Uncharacterized protein n=1 Tax=Brucella lupini TaxID=255457 RepID=A0A256GIE5_9HYPH|nr:hypothetical protein [Brucella lupini]KAB2705060.1 hypothetical protein F9L03_06630 [Brucella lupini]OYR26892.1 hypothetical protein CES86_3244 [Brucella lupini]
MANEPALYARMEMRVAQAEKQMAKFAKQLDGQMGGMERRTNKAAKNMESSLSRGFSKMQGIVSEFGKGLFAGIAAGGVAGIAASVQAVTKSFADLGREAQTAGINVKDFQKWRYVADQNRIGVDALIDGFKELNLRADEYIQTGKGSAAESFQRLGMSPAEVKERIKDPSKFMLELIDRTRRLKDTAAGVRIFDELLGGQGGEQFVRLIEQGRDGITKTLNEAEKMGAVFDAEFIKKADEIDKAFNRLATTMGTAVKGAIVEAATALQGFLSSWQNLEDKTLSGINAELDTLTKRKAQLEAQAGTTEDAVLGWIGKDAATELQAVNEQMARLQARKDELTAVKLETIVIDPPEKPYTPPPPSKTGKSSDEKARDRAAKAAERERKAVTDLIKDLEFEASLVGKSALEKEKMTALRHAGAAATAAEKAQIEQLVEANYKATEAYDKQQAAIQEVNDAGREFAGTLVSGLLSGAKASDVLSDALGRLADRFLNSGLDALFGGGGGGIGGLFSGIFGGGSSDPWSGLRLAGGGHVRGRGSATSDSIPAMLSNGEYVINAAATKKFGPLLDAINSGKGLALAGGGAVGVPSVASLSAPRIPSLAGMSQTNNNTQNNSPNINVNVSGANGNAEIAAMVQEGVSRGLATWQEQTSTTRWIGQQASIARTKYRVGR